MASWLACCLPQGYSLLTTWVPFPNMVTGNHGSFSRHIEMGYFINSWSMQYDSKTCESLQTLELTKLDHSRYLIQCFYLESYILERKQNLLVTFLDVLTRLPQVSSLLDEKFRKTIKEVMIEKRRQLSVQVKTERKSLNEIKTTALQIIEYRKVASSIMASAVIICEKFENLEFFPLPTV